MKIPVKAERVANTVLLTFLTDDDAREFGTSIMERMLRVRTMRSHPFVQAPVGVFCNWCGHDREHRNHDT